MQVCCCRSDLPEFATRAGEGGATRRLHPLDYEGAGWPPFLIFFALCCCYHSVFLKKSTPSFHLITLGFMVKLGSGDHVKKNV